jgi:hypothetical protein
MADEDKRKHLDLLQAVIGRMAANSFLLRGWSVTLTTALFGFAATAVEARLAFLAVAPVLVFWGLDAYYLGYERRFRERFDEARTEAATDYRMTPAPLGFAGWAAAACRPGVLFLHLPLVIIALAVGITLAISRPETPP